MNKRKRKSRPHKAIKAAKAKQTPQSRSTVASMPSQDPGLVDPRDLKSRPEAPLPGIDRRLEVEPLPGPNEASDDVPQVEEANNEGLVDPRYLLPEGRK